MKQAGLSFAYKNGKIIDISEVKRGLACDCTCPICGAKLIANKGEKNKHHFKHYRVEECKHYGETLLHLAGKQIIMENREIILPKFSIYTGQYSISSKFSYFKVEEEKRVENIIPDTVLYFENNQKIFVEIKVTHEVDEDKFLKLKEIGISTLEIDLSNLVEKNGLIPDLNELREIVLYRSYNRKWVYEKNYDKNMMKHQEELEYERFAEVMEECDEEYRKNYNFEKSKKKRLSLYKKSIIGFVKETKVADLFGSLYLEEWEEEVMILFEPIKSVKCPSLKYILAEYTLNDCTYRKSKLGALFENNGKLNGTITITGSKLKVEILETKKLKNWDFEIRLKPNLTRKQF